MASAGGIRQRVKVRFEPPADVMVDSSACEGEER